MEDLSHWDVRVGTVGNGVDGSTYSGSRSVTQGLVGTVRPQVVPKGPQGSGFGEAPFVARLSCPPLGPGRGGGEGFRPPLGSGREGGEGFGPPLGSGRGGGEGFGTQDLH